MDFSKYLNIYYLSVLAEKDLDEAFRSLYPSVERDIAEIAGKTSDDVVFSRIESINAYKAKLLSKSN